MEGAFDYYDKQGNFLEKQVFKNDIRIDTCWNKFKAHICRNKCCYIFLLIIISIGFCIGITLLLVYFLVKCKKGEGDKCLTCKRFSKSCASCNEGYELFQGKCITYQFMVKYYTMRLSFDGPEKIINDYNVYDSFYYIKLNGEIENDFKWNSLKFPSWGEHTVHFYFDKEEITSFSNMFRNTCRIIFRPASLS